MLIEFKVANFRSIREEQTFSLVANNADKELPGCVIERELPGLSKVKFLKGAAIYGANASGKSNVMEAIHFLAILVTGSATRLQPGQPTGTQPFKLDAASASKPSVFEVTFVSGGVRYLFGLSVTSQRVLEEYLVAYPKGTPQHWYHRTYNATLNAYEWAKPSTGFKHDKSLEEKVRDNSLYLSVGPQFNHPQLTAAYGWFNAGLQFIQLGAEEVFTHRQTLKALSNDLESRKIFKILQNADIGIVGGEVIAKELDFGREDGTWPDETNELITKIAGDSDFWESVMDRRVLQASLFHKGEGQSPISLDFKKEESAGTRRFFGLLGPWLDILENGKTVFIDEIETSLHPLLVRELLKLLLSEETNPKGAQVVFTTHNPLLMDSSLLRRDQVWFTEKSATGVTHLYPLSDYQPRKDEALAKGYMAGRYGGIPYLPEGLKL